MSLGGCIHDIVIFDIFQLIPFGLNCVNTFYFISARFFFLIFYFHVNFLATYFVGVPS